MFHFGRLVREECANKFITPGNYIYIVFTGTTYNCDNALATNCTTAAIFLLAPPPVSSGKNIFSPS